MRRVTKTRRGAVPRRCGRRLPAPAPAHRCQMSYPTHPFTRKTPGRRSFSLSLCAPLKPPPPFLAAFLATPPAARRPLEAIC